MSKNNSIKKQSYYGHFAQLLLVVLGIVLIYYFRENIGAGIVTAFVLVYFVANTYYAYTKKELSPERVLEYGIISLVCEFLLLNYIV